MKKSILAMLLAFCMLLSLTACSNDSSNDGIDPAPSGQNAAADGTIEAPIVWKMQTNVNTDTMVYDNGAVAFADLVKEKSGGRLEIEVYPANAIVASSEITTSVGKGVVEMGLGGPSLDTGLLAEAVMCAGLPFGWENGLQAYEYWHEYKDGAAYELLNEAYHEMGVELVHILCFDDAYGLMTSFEIESLHDVSKKQIRATGNYGTIMGNLGASTVSMAISEVYMGLSMGTIDGVVMGFSTLEDFQLKEVLDCVVEPAFCAGVPSTFYCNLDAWNSLPDELKTIVQEAAAETFKEVLYPASLEIGDNLYNHVIPEAGMEVISLSDEDVAAMLEASASIWDAAEDASARSGEMMQLLKEFLDEKGQDYPGK